MTFIENRKFDRNERLCEKVVRNQVKCRLELVYGDFKDWDEKNVFFPIGKEEVLKVLDWERAF